nr:reverse transcriptase domain-containing protein [Tanacetum cinerariifolium]
MAFDLKNAGTTHQRLMNKAFKSQIGRNIEVCVYDLVVKSYTEAEMLRDIEETFHTLRKINIKLNPKKMAAKMKYHASRAQYYVQAKNVSQRTYLSRFFIEMPDENPQAAPVAETKQDPLTLFTDDSSCFAASNNEVEYEALIVGLRIAAHVGVKNVHVSVDSKLVANQVLGTYVAKEDNMVKYLDKVKSLVKGFTNFSISQVSRSKNTKAYALSKITSTSFTHLSKQVLVEVLKDKCIEEKDVETVVEEDGPTWKTPIVEYLKEGTLPSDRNEARKLRIKARRYELMEGILYKRSFLMLWLRCVGPLQVEYVIREIHEGSCIIHAGPQSVVAKAIRLGYYWPTMHQDALIPQEIGMPMYCTTAVDVVSNDEELQLNLDLLKERRERAAICEAKAKSKMIKYYNARVHGVTFRPGDFVYRSNDASHAIAKGKLGPKWEGLYEVTEALGDGAYKLRSMDGTILPRT